MSALDYSFDADFAFITKDGPIQLFELKKTEFKNLHCNIFTTKMSELAAYVRNICVFPRVLLTVSAE